MMRPLLLAGPVLFLSLVSCGSSDDVRGPFPFPTDGTVAARLSFEDAWLDVPWNNALDRRTMLGVMGLRTIRVTDDTNIELVYGPSFSNYEVWEDGFEIISKDDPNYAPADLVNPIGVTVNTEPEVIDPLGVTADRQVQWVVRLLLSDPLKPGATYRVRAIGGRELPDDIDPEYHWRAPWWGYPFTGGANAGSFSLDQGPSPVTDDVVAGVMGLRGVAKISPNILKVTLGAATAESLLEDPSQYSLLAGGETLVPAAVHRQTAPEVYVPGTGWPFSVSFYRHEVYLEFDRDLPSGSGTLAVEDGLTGGRTRLETPLGTLRNAALKVNQEGYLTTVPHKRAYYGAWMGTGGALDVPDGIGCEVRDKATDAVVWSGSFVQRHALGTAGEGPYNVDSSGEEVYACDFGDLEKPGTYRVYADGLGYSYPFVIGDTALDRAHRVALYGVLWQRAGDDLKGTGSRYTKVAGHHDDDVLIPYMEDRPIRGGHYDAGDYNPRVHTSIARDFMMVCDLMPEKCGDGDFAVPEGINGVPDMLDEAAWSLLPLLDLQDTDGGIAGQVSENWGWSTPIESMADANFIETPERDPYQQYAGEKNLRMTVYCAGLFAQAAHLWGRLGKAEKASTYRDAAMRAWGYGMAASFEGNRAELSFAAAHMARMTGDEAYLDWWDVGGYAPSGGDDDGSGAHIAAAYLSLPADMGSDLVRNALETAFISHGQGWADMGETYAYPRMHHPWAPTSWGTGCYPTYAQGIVLAHAIAQSDETLQWLHNGIDLALGANAMNRSFITGLGDDPIVGPLHINGWHTWQGLVPPGLQSEGPQGDVYDLGDSNLVPSGAAYPTMHFYFDTRFVDIPMHEPVMVNFGSVATVLTALKSDSPNVP